MKKNQNYEINFATNTITVKKSFLKEASQIGTDAYYTMKKLRKMDMDITEKETHRKKTGPKWSFERMELYLCHVEDGEKYRAAYKAIMACPHATVWAWFKKTFPHYNKMPILNEKNEYLIHPAEYEQKKNVRGSIISELDKNNNTGIADLKMVS